jgi:hypothetical protein
MFKVPTASLQTFTDTPIFVLEHRVQYSTVRVQYSTVRIQYSTVSVQYSTVRVQYSTVRVQYSTVHIPNVLCDSHLQIISCVKIVRIH